MEGSLPNANFPALTGQIAIALPALKWHKLTIVYLNEENSP